VASRGAKSPIRASDRDKPFSKTTQPSATAFLLKWPFRADETAGYAF